MARHGAGRRGQAALEFLTTYGWICALLLLSLVMMAWLGGSRPEGLLPDRCILSPAGSLECLGATATDDGILLLRIRSLEDLRLIGAACSYQGSALVTTRSVLIGAEEPSAAGSGWAEGQVLPLSCIFDGDNPFAGAEGRRRRLTVTLTLADSEGIARSIDADVRITVRAADGSGGGP